MTASCPVCISPSWEKLRKKASRSKRLRQRSDGQVLPLEPCVSCLSAPQKQGWDFSLRDGGTPRAHLAPKPFPHTPNGSKAQSPPQKFPFQSELQERQVRICFLSWRSSDQAEAAGGRSSRV